MLNVETDAAATAYTDSRVVRVRGNIACPFCLGRLRASAVRETGDGGYAVTCQECHHDIITITSD